MWRSGGALDEGRVGKRKAKNRRRKKNGKFLKCGEWDESDDSETLPRREFHKFVEDRVASLTGSKLSSVGEVTNSATIPTPTWRKINEVDSEDSGASTFIADSKLGRSRPVARVPRGRYAMGAPRTDMSEFLSKRDDDTEDDSGATDNTEVVSMLCLILRV